MVLQWVKESCHSRFILKGDDDVFVSFFLTLALSSATGKSKLYFQVNPFEVSKLIEKMEEDKPLVHGSVMGNNPVIRDHRSKYADFKWNKERYPTYVSGGGFIMNYMAAMAIQRQIPTTPLIAIDDAYIG